MPASDTHDADTSDTPAKPTASFFQVGLHALQTIAKNHGSHRDVAAYLIICAGVNERAPVRISTHGAKSIEQRAGMSYRKAENCLAWLQAQGLIRKPEAADLENGWRGPQHRALWVITDDSPDVAICQQFINGVMKGTKKPLAEFLEMVKGADAITQPEAGVDALVLFAVLMREQDFGDWAGVNPEIWCGELPVVDEEEEDDEGNPLAPGIVPLGNTGNSVVTVRDSQEANAHVHAMDAAFPYIDETETRSARFWHALEQLLNARLVYRALVLWRGNPVGSHKPRQAFPEATLHINDGWARAIDATLQPEVNRTVWRHHLDNSEHDFDQQGEINPALNGRYRFIVKEGREHLFNVLGQLRVRYWAANPSTVAGRALDKSRTERWNSQISALGVTRQPA